MHCVAKFEIVTFWKYLPNSYRRRMLWLHLSKINAFFSSWPLAEKAFLKYFKTWKCRKISNYKWRKYESKSQAERTELSVLYQSSWITPTSFFFYSDTELWLCIILRVFLLPRKAASGRHWMFSKHQYRGISTRGLYLGTLYCNNLERSALCLPKCHPILQQRWVLHEEPRLILMKNLACVLLRTILRKMKSCLLTEYLDSTLS